MKTKNLFNIFNKKIKKQNGEVNIVILILLVIAIVICTQFYGAINGALTAVNGGSMNIPNAVNLLTSAGYAVAATGQTFNGNVNGTITGTITAPTGRTATYVIAASDATAVEKAQADVVCVKVGSYDNSISLFQTYIDLATTKGGTVSATSGNYYPDATGVVPIFVKSNVKLDLGKSNWHWDGVQHFASSPLYYYALFTAQGSVTATTSLLTSNGVSGNNSITVALGSEFAIGEYVWLSSTNVPLAGAEGYNWPDGEIHKVINVSGNVVTFAEPLYRAYTTANTSILSLLSPIINWSINGGNFVGLNNPSQGSLIFGANISAVWCAEFQIANTHMLNYDWIGIGIADSVSGNIFNNYIECHGIETIANYGILTVGCDANLDIHDNYVTGATQAIVGGGSDEGSPMYCFVSNNTLISNGQGDQIDMHTCDSWGFQYNSNYVSSNGYGVGMGGVQYSLTGNTIISYLYCIYPRDATVSNIDVTLTNNYCSSVTQPLIYWITNSGVASFKHITINGLFQLSQMGSAPAILIRPTSQTHGVVDIQNVQLTKGNITYAMIDIRQVDEVNISNSQIASAGSGFDNIFVTNAIRGNITNNKSSLATRAGLYLYNSTNMIIQSNYFYGNNDGYMESNGSGYNIVSNNFFNTNSSFNMNPSYIATSTRVYGNTGYIASGETRTISGSLAGVTPAGIMSSIDNPFGQAVRVMSVDVEVTTQGAASGTMDVGIGSSNSADYNTMFNVLPCDNGTSYPYFFNSIKTGTYGVQTNPIYWNTGAGNRYLNFYAHVANLAYVATYTITIMGN
jgi:parallel beta-helix repeat protein